MSARCSGVHAGGITMNFCDRFQNAAVINRFAEPGMFLVRPVLSLYDGAVQTMPFVRKLYQACYAPPKTPSTRSPSVRSRSSTVTIASILLEFVKNAVNAKVMSIKAAGFGFSIGVKPDTNQFNG